MQKNIIIAMLFALLMGSLFVNFRKWQINAADQYGHPWPKTDLAYGLRDPSDNQLKLIVYATEWTDGRWALMILSKTEDNKVYRFWTISPNDPRHWMSDKLEYPDSMESQPIAMEVIDRGNEKNGSYIWIEKPKQIQLTKKPMPTTIQ